MDEIPNYIFTQIETLSENGNIALDLGKPDEAIAHWTKALDLLPPPQTRWEAAMWLYASLGDAYRSKNDHEKALSAFQAANASGDGAMNAFVQFGLGVSLYDLGRKEDATDPLLRAYMMEGRDIFCEEPHVYFKHLSDQKLTD